MATHGAADSHILSMRQSVARVRGLDSQLGSMRLGFLLRPHDRDDPAIFAHTLPLCAWARTVWNCSVPSEDLQSVFYWAERRRETSASPWQRVVGPSGATMTSLARLGWTALSATEWITDLSVFIDLRLVCPKTVSKLVRAAVVRWTWRQLAKDRPDLAHLEGGAELKPIVDLLRSPPTPVWTRAMQGCLGLLCSTPLRLRRD